jgi:hypothetical protein
MHLCMVSLLQWDYMKALNFMCIEENLPPKLERFFLLVSCDVSGMACKNESSVFV